MNGKDVGYDGAGFQRRFQPQFQRKAQARIAGMPRNTAGQRIGIIRYPLRSETQSGAFGQPKT